MNTENKSKIPAPTKATGKTNDTPETARIKTKPVMPIPTDDDYRYIDKARWGIKGKIREIKASSALETKDMVNLLHLNNNASLSRTINEAPPYVVRANILCYLRQLGFDINALADGTEPQEPKPSFPQLYQMCRFCASGMKAVPELMDDLNNFIRKEGKENSTSLLKRIREEFQDIRGLEKYKNCDLVEFCDGLARYSSKDPAADKQRSRFATMVKNLVENKKYALIPPADLLFIMRRVFGTDLNKLLCDEEVPTLAFRPRIRDLLCDAIR